MTQKTMAKNRQPVPENELEFDLYLTNLRDSNQFSLENGDIASNCYSGSYLTGTTSKLSSS